ncbi:MAG TPA: hypothetical protein GX497_00205 [Bacillus bacterium]|nr:hypothetical protein [Bacillus sp. (in: firmicutes)]
MHKSTFDDEQLEKLLQSFPKVKDNQDPDQLFAKISSRIEEEKVAEKQVNRKNPVRKKRTWILPTLASIAAVIIVVIVVPSFLYEQDHTMENAQIESQKEKMIEDDTGDNAENFLMMAEEGSMARIAAENQSHIIMDVEENQEILTAFVPDANAQFVVPISFIVPKEGASTRLKRLESIKDYLHEDEWGLSDYILENVKLSEKDNGKKLIIDVPINHSYGNGSTMEIIFLETVKLTAKQLGYEAVEFRTEGKLGIMLGNYGELTELNLKKNQTKGIYFVLQPNGHAQKFLVPIQMDVDFSDAIAAMKLPIELDTEQIILPIRAEINFKRITLNKEKNEAIIEFAEGTPLANDENSLLMIEAILMTAKEYGVQSVLFINASQNIIGPFNLLEPISIPLAVNPMPY